MQRFKPVFGHPIRCDLGQGRVEFEDVFEVELELEELRVTSWCLVSSDCNWNDEKHIWKGITSHFQKWW